MLRRLLVTLSMAAGLVALGGCTRPARLVVYTAAEADQLPAYEASFRKLHPEINIVWVRDSTGVVTAKLLAESRDEQADVVFALAATSMKQLEAKGLLAPYAPRGVEHLDPKFRDGAPTPKWTGEALWSVAICANTDELRKHNLPVPQHWDDLAKPIYRGMISMPNPASSGTGLLAVGAWLQTRGEADGWDYMDRLDKNIASYTHSGSKPCKDAARGEIPIGVSIDFRAAQSKLEGLPIEVVVPTEGVGWDLEASGLVTGARNPAAAKVFLDWAMSRQAMEIYAKNFAMVADPTVRTQPLGLPADMKARLAKVDLGWTAANRDRIIGQWSAKFSAKSSPKP